MLKCTWPLISQFENFPCMSIHEHNCLVQLTSQWIKGISSSQWKCVNISGVKKERVLLVLGSSSNSSLFPLFWIWIPRILLSLQHFPKSIYLEHLQWNHFISVILFIRNKTQESLIFKIRVWAIILKWKTRKGWKEKSRCHGKWKRVFSHVDGAATTAFDTESEAFVKGMGRHVNKTMLQYFVYLIQS